MTSRSTPPLAESRYCELCRANVTMPCKFADCPQPGIEQQMRTKAALEAYYAQTEAEMDFFDYYQPENPR